MEESAPLLKSVNSITGHGSIGKSRDIEKVENDEFLVRVKQRTSSSNSGNVSSSNVTCQTYWYRWYISFIFSFMAMLEGAVWNTWGPINESAETAFGFAPNEIELLTNWGPIAIIAAMPFFMWCLDKKGLRMSSVSTAFLIALGTGLRCLPLDPSVLRYFIHAGQILNGLGGCVVMAAPPLLSNIWFPPHERITATGVSTLMNYIGAGFAYSVGMIVDVPSNSNESYTDCATDKLPRNSTCGETIHIRKQIRALLYVEFGLALFVFISMLIFFPNRPPKPPSVSAAIPRVELKSGLLQLRHRKQFWIVALLWSLVLGTWGGWTGVMPIILNPLGISQSESGLLGLVMTLVGSIVGMLVGWFTDRLKGKMKLMLTILFSLSFVCFSYFIIISNKWINIILFSPGSVQTWIVCILLGILMNASVPVGMEMAADAGYPTCEGTSSAIVGWFFNVLSFVLLFVIGFLPNPLNANYIIFAALLVSVPSLIFFTNEENRRLDLDSTHLNGNFARTKYRSVEKTSDE